MTPEQAPYYVEDTTRRCRQCRNMAEPDTNICSTCIEFHHFDRCDVDACDCEQFKQFRLMNPKGY